MFLKNLESVEKPTHAPEHSFPVAQTYTIGIPSCTGPGKLWRISMISHDSEMVVMVYFKMSFQKCVKPDHRCSYLMIDTHSNFIVLLMQLEIWNMLKPRTLPGYCWSFEVTRPGVALIDGKDKFHQACWGLRSISQLAVDRSSQFLDFCNEDSPQKNGRNHRSKAGLKSWRQVMALTALWIFVLEQDISGRQTFRWHSQAAVTCLAAGETQGHRSVHWVDHGTAKNQDCS